MKIPTLRCSNKCSNLIGIGSRNGRSFVTCRRQIRCISNLPAVRRAHPRKILTRWFTTTTADNNNHEDGYQFYREPSKDLWNVIQQNNRKTLEAVDAQLRLESEQDILAAVSSSSLPSFPELGPTGNYFYTTRNSPNGKLQYLRKPTTAQKNDDHHQQSSSSSQEEEEEVVILEVEMANFELLAMSLSIDETMIAYLLRSIDLPEETQLRIKHLNSNKTTWLNTITQANNVEWGPRQTNGNHSLFFTTTNAWGRPDSVFACELSNNNAFTSPQNYQRIYHTSDEAVMAGIQRTKGCHYLAISATTKTSNEVYLVGGDDLSQPPLLVRARQAGIEYHVDVGTNHDVYILANTRLDGELTLYIISVANLPLITNNFGEVMAQPEEGFVIKDMDIFRKAVVLYENSTVDGKERIRFISKEEGSSEFINTVAMPTTTTTQIVNPHGNMYYDALGVTFDVESPVARPKAHEYLFNEKIIRSLSKSSTTPSLLNDEYLDGDFVHSQILVESFDNIKVPLSVIHSPKVDLREDSPVVVLHGYGAYGEPVVRGFDPSLLALLEKGVVLAFAHVRGGGELGKSWYHGGRRHQKMNAVEDYLSCARALINPSSFNVDPSNLVAKAFSAGGAIVGAAINREPELFGSAIMVNAFLDVQTSMYQKDLALTEHEYDEWGDPTSDFIAADVINTICPMSNLKKSSSHYPRMLIVGTMNDMNVPFWHATAFHAKLEKVVSSCKKNEKQQQHLLYVVEQGGHQLAFGTRLEVAALVNSFILQLKK